MGVVSQNAYLETRWLKTESPLRECIDFRADFKVKLEASQTAVSLESFGPAALQRVADAAKRIATGPWRVCRY